MREEKEREAAMKQKMKRMLFKIIPVFTSLMISGIPVFAKDHSGETMWETADRIIVDVYNNIAGISTVLAALMTTVAVIGMKISSNQQKVDRSVDWLKRIWVAWAVINGIGAFLAYVRPLLAGLNTITP